MLGPVLTAIEKKTSVLSPRSGQGRYFTAPRPARGVVSRRSEGLTARVDEVGSLPPRSPRRAD
jgi:hypothetical protein